MDHDEFAKKLKARTMQVNEFIEEMEKVISENKQTVSENKEWAEKSAAFLEKRKSIVRFTKESLAQMRQDAILIDEELKRRKSRTWADVRMRCQIETDGIDKKH